MTRPGVLLEEVLEPGDGVGVEVVRRLVQQQQVGRRQEQPAERDATPLAAGQRGDVGVARRQPQGVHRRVEHAVEVPGVGAVDQVLHLALLLEQRVHLLVAHRLREAHAELVEALQEVALLAHAVLDVAADVLGLVEVGLLRQVADARAGGEPGLAARGLLEAGHDAQQGRLAGAVRSQDADLGAVQERERDLLEDLALRAVELVDPVHRVHEFGLGAHGGRIGGPRTPPARCPGRPTARRGGGCGRPAARAACGPRRPARTTSGPRAARRAPR